MPYENVYEHFRTILSLNLLTVVDDHEKLKEILNMVDMSMSDFEKLQSLLGHTNPQTTLIYAKLNDEQMKMEHQKAFC